MDCARTICCGSLVLFKLKRTVADATVLLYLAAVVMMVAAIIAAIIIAAKYAIVT